MREIGTRRELEPLLESRLIVERGGTVNFSLAILREWFGAQALVSDEVTRCRVLNSSTLANAWVNSMIIAVAIFDNDRASELLQPLAAKHPGVASLVVHQAISPWGILEEPFAAPVLECGRQIREAMQSWVTGIGRLALLIAPLRPNGSVRSLGVKRHGAYLTASWYEGESEIEDIHELPALDDLMNSGGWLGVRMACPARQPAWAWKWALEELTSRISDLMVGRSLPVVDGPLVDEILWPQLVLLCYVVETLTSSNFLPQQ